MIKVIENKEHLLRSINGMSSIGFVPTMGNLHRGHLSLVERALKDNETVVVSIFVNPTQFGENEDFSNYPRTLEQDIERIKNLGSNKEIIIFSPKDTREVYGGEAKSYLHANRSIAGVLEGAVRPTHFDGVISVVDQLFNLVKPKNAYFGKKDYQQLLLIQELANQKHPNTKIIGMPIVREDNGLAMSSRNNYLSESQKLKALNLNKTLNSIIKSGRSIHDKNDSIEKVLKVDKNFNYIEIRNPETFEVSKQGDASAVILGNYSIAGTRLLDNIEFKL